MKIKISDDTIYKICNKLNYLKKPESIAEFDFYLSMLLNKLEEHSNFFDICETLGITPWGKLSKSAIIYCLKNPSKGTFENCLLNKIKSVPIKEYVFEEDLGIEINLKEIKNGKIRFSIKARDSEYAKNKFKELKTLYLSLIYLFYFSGKVKKLDFSFSYLEGEKIELSEAKVRTIAKLIDKIESKRESLKKLLKNSLSNYALAISEKNVKISFLLFWISLETLVKSGKLMRNEDIVARIEKLYSKKELFDSLRHMYIKRNKLVHSFDINISIDERNLMKSISETIILFTLLNLYRLDNLDDLSSIYSVHPNSNVQKN